MGPALAYFRAPSARPPTPQHLPHLEAMASSHLLHCGHKQAEVGWWPDRLLLHMAVGVAAMRQMSGMDGLAVKAMM